MKLVTHIHVFGILINRLVSTSLQATLGIMMTEDTSMLWIASKN